MAMINIKLPTAVLGRQEPGRQQFPRTAAPELRDLRETHAEADERALAESV